MWHQITYFITVIFVIAQIGTLIQKLRNDEYAFDKWNKVTVAALKWIIVTGILGTLISIVGGVISDLLGGSFYEWFEYTDDDGYQNNFHSGFKNAFYLTFVALIIYKIKGLEFSDIFKNFWF
jgi:hypothetical protein